MEQADLLSQLEEKPSSEDGYFTLFAPTSSALASLDEDVVRAITEDQQLLEDVVKYHLVPGGKLFTRVMKDGLLAETSLSGASLRFGVAEVTDKGGDKSGEEEENERVVTVNGALLEPGYFIFLLKKSSCEGIVVLYASLISFQPH